MKNSVLMLAWLFALIGCQANDNSLADFVRQIDQQTLEDVVDVPIIVNFQISEYRSHQLRQPFSLPKVALKPNQPDIRDDCWQPNERQKIGQLESFPLSQLKLKGVIGSDEQLSALVQIPTGNVIPVNQGQYLGLDNGEVVYISENYIEIREVLADGLGCWDKRSVKLSVR